jgi:tetratricopeptide (TPR) repeat protein
MKIVLQIILFSILFIPTLSFAQDIDIVPYLKQIEAGELSAVKEKLPELKVKYPGSPAIMFLDGVLTEDGQQAVVIYQRIIEKYPNSKYADAAVYRVFSYFYALGLYEAAEKMREKLNTEYPDSPYRKLAEANKTPDFKTSTQPGETPKISTPPTTRTDYRFTIQAGAFSNSANAINLKNDFERAGYITEMKEKNVGGTNFQIVYVGKFALRRDAEDFLHIINSKFNLNGRVIEITP